MLTQRDPSFKRTIPNICGAVVVLSVFFCLFPFKAVAQESSSQQTSANQGSAKSDLRESSSAAAAGSAYAQETTDAQASIVQPMLVKKVNEDIVSDGPLFSERKKLLADIQAAAKRGTGIAAYMALLHHIDQLVNGGASEEAIRSLIQPVARALAEQQKKRQLFTVQFGNLIVATYPVKAELKVFDPAHRPAIAGIPTDMDALTNFEIHDNVKVHWNDSSQSISKADVALTCTAVIWIPSNCTKKLREHEEGHLKICEILYQKGNLVARQIGQRYLMGCNYNGGRAIDVFSQKYKAEVIDVIDWLYKCYDKITDHGRNQVSSGKAVEQCFQLCYRNYKGYLEK